jgi:hypothetical protein
MDFFLSAEVIGLGLYLSFGIHDFVHVFSRWDLRVGKGDVVVKCVNLLSSKNYSPVTSLGETCCCCVTWCSWLVGDTSSFRVEGTLVKGNHFLNKMSKIGP